MSNFARSRGKARVAASSMKSARTRATARDRESSQREIKRGPAERVIEREAHEERGPQRARERSSQTELEKSSQRELDRGGQSARERFGQKAKDNFTLS